MAGEWDPKIVLLDTLGLFIPYFSSCNTLPSWESSGLTIVAQGPKSHGDDLEEEATGDDFLASVMKARSCCP